MYDQILDDRTALENRFDPAQYDEVASLQFDEVAFSIYQRQVTVLVDFTWW